MAKKVIPVPPKETAVATKKEKRNLNRIERAILFVFGNSNDDNEFDHLSDAQKTIHLTALQLEQVLEELENPSLDSEGKVIEKTEPVNATDNDDDE